MIQTTQTSRWHTCLSLLLIISFIAFVRLTSLDLPSLKKRAQQLAIIEAAQQIYPDIQSTQQGFSPEEIESIAAQKHLWKKRSNELLLELKAQHQASDYNKKTHTFVSGHDSYHWLRLARNVIEKGTHCDDGYRETCRNMHSLAPVGHAQDYLALPHVYSLAFFHKVVRSVHNDDYPLTASANWFSILMALLVIFPAFFIGKQLAGLPAGIGAALIVSLGSIYLERTMGVDTDIWNVFLLLSMLWFTMNALRSQHQSQALFWVISTAIMTGLWANIWSGWLFGYLIILSGLFFHCFLEVLQKKGRQIFIQNTTLVVIYVITCGVVVQFGPAEIQYLQLPHEIYHHLISDQPEQATSELLWPDHLSAVAEWKKVELTGLYDSMGGVFPFFLALCGALLLLASKSNSYAGFKLLMYCFFIYSILLFWQPHMKLLLFLILAAPLFFALLYHTYRADIQEQGFLSITGLLIIALLASLWLGYNAKRFLLFSWPVMAIFAGVTISVFSLWLNKYLQIRHFKKTGMLLSLLLFSALTIKMILPGIITSLNSFPNIQRSYQQTFSDLLVKSDDEAIITALWEYGYWIQYYADRRTSTDGGTLLNNANFWVNKVYAQNDERKAIGILRMLNCSSDASNVPEKQFSAMEQIKAAGVSEKRAFQLLLELLKMNKTEAEDFIQQQPKLSSFSDQILQTTHCTPPESFLLTSTHQIINAMAWTSTGFSDPLDLSPETKPAKSLKLEPSWYGCISQTKTSRKLTCSIQNISDDSRKLSADKFVIDLNRPDAARFYKGHKTGLAGKPGTLLIANKSKLEKISLDNSDLPGQGVLINPETHQIMVGNALVLESVYTQLHLLNGRFSDFFETVISHSDPHGGSVIAWRIKRWE